MKERIFGSIMLAMLLISTLNLAFFIKPSLAKNDEGGMFAKDFSEIAREAALSKENSNVNQINGFDTTGRNIFERKPDAERSKTSENPNQAALNTEDNWRFDDTSEWSNFAYLHGNKTRLIVGVNSEKPPSLLDLDRIVAKHQAEIVSKVSIGGKLRAVVVELFLSTAAAFAQETRDADLASYVEPNMKVQTQFVPNDPYWTNQWGPRKIEADWAWNTTIGSHDILVAVVDTGIDYTHSDLAANYVALGYDWVNNDNDPVDDHGHGTHCAGIIAGTLNNNIGIAGLAQVRITAEKVLNSGGGGYWDWVASGIIHAADSGADIISMSLAGYGYSELVHEAVRYAYDAGVLVIAAAANDNTNVKAYPAGYDEVIAVSATDEYDNKASFSNWGDWIELAAPGVSIYSTVPWGYESWSGTSMAAPHVSGIAALVCSLHPEKTREWVRLWLRYTADDLGDPGFDIYYGYGRINARKAVEQPPPAHELIAYDWETPPYIEPSALGVINASVLNFGENNETDVAVQLFANDTIVSSALLSFLAAGDSTCVSLTWNPAIEGLYNLTLCLEPVPGETSVENNVLWKYIYVGFPVKAVVLHSAGNIISEIITNWQLLNNQWHLFGDTMVYIDYTTLNKDDITYEDIAATEADVLIISCAYDPYAGWEFTDSEIEAITRYVHEGHGLIATAGTLYDGVPNNNKLARLFGMNETTKWTSTGTDLLNLVNMTHPIFVRVPNPLVFPQVGTALPSDGRWDQNELEGGGYLALGHYQESAIVTFRGLVYISPWLEVIQPYYHHHLQLLYNAITWSRYQKPQHELMVSLEVPKYLEPGEPTLLNAAIYNMGLNNETDVELYLLIEGEVANSTIVSVLPIGTFCTINYLWTPTVEKLYNITAYAPPVLGEESIFNNIATKMVRVMFPIKVAVLGDYQSQLTKLLLENGIIAQERSWDILADIYEYNAIIVNRPYDPGASTFLAFLEAADSYNVGLVFTSSWLGSTAPYGISLLQWYLGDPEGQGDTYGQGSVYYKVTQEHPIFENWNIGDTIYIITTGDGDHSWFWGYSGETIANIGADYTGIRGGGIAYKIQEMGSKHLLLAGLAPQSYANTAHWTEEAKLLLVQGVFWVVSKPEHDLAVSVEVPEYQMPGDTVILDAKVRNQGLNNETDVEIFLILEGETVNHTVIPQLPVGASQKVTYLWTPTEEGICNATAYAPPVENETLTANNIATKFPKVMCPLIRPIEGQYANYTMYYIDTGTGQETFAGLWNFTYLNYISPYQINITTWMKDQNNYTQTGWMIVNIFTRMVESDSGIYWTGMWYPGWIETDVTIGSTINLLWGNATIGDSRVVLVGGFPIDCWEIQLEQYGWIYTFWYDKASGLWIAMSSPGPYNLAYLVLTTTNVPLGFQYEHDLAVMLEAPARLSPGTSTTLNATVYNTGLSNEAEVALQLAINGSLVASEVVPELASGDFYTLSYPWTPTIEGVYNLTVYSSPVVGEEYIENNIKTRMANVRVVAVALISDHSELSAITYMLDSMGINYDIYNNNNAHLYTADLSLLLNYKAVVFYTDYRWITTEEATALNSYLSQDGSLIVTGFDCLVSDARLADVVHSATMGDNVGRPELRVVDAAHPIMNGPYGSFPAVYYIEGLYGDCDRVEADSARGAVTVAELTDGYDKIIATEVSLGKVVFWNGRGDYDWTWNADCQAMFKNTIHWMTVIPEHELAVSLEVPAFLTPDVSATLNATVRNLGSNNETNVELQLWINGTMVKSEVVSELSTGSSYVLSYLWAPTVEGLYNVTAWAPPLSTELLLTNNIMTRLVRVMSVPVVYVNPQIVAKSVGSTFTVSVEVFNLTANYPLGNLYGLDIQFVWDHTMLEYVNHTVTIPVEVYPAGVLHSPILLIKDEVNVSEGTYWLAVSSMYPAASFNNPDASNTVFVMTFRIVGEGTTNLELVQTDLAGLWGEVSEPIPHVSLNGVVVAGGPQEDRDVAIVDVTCDPNAIYPGRIVSITTVASNIGNVTEDFNVTAYANTTIIGSQTVYSLAPGENTTIIFDWDTTGLAPRSNFTLWAEASQVPGETSIDDNRFADGYVYIKHQGDVNGDGIVNIYDIVLGVAAYGSQTGDSNWNEDVDLAPPYGIINLYDIVTIIANYGK